MIKAVFIIEWKGFYRSPPLVASCLFLLLAGIYAIHYGSEEINRQRTVIRLVEEKGAEQFDSLVRGFAADTTRPAGKKSWSDVAEPRNTWYLHKYPAVFKPAPLAELSLGLRDIFPYYQQLHSHSLYMQVFKGEIANPEKLLTGNLDLAFVLVFLFPLFIIGMGYDIVSGEKDSGVYAILKTQATSFSRIVLSKLLFRFSLISVMAMALCVAGGASISWCGFTLVYVAFWHAVVYCIGSMNKNSAFNAMVLVTGWLLFLIVLPALFNALAIFRYPVNQTHLSNYIRRIQVDESKDGLYRLAQNFYSKYPWLDDHDTSAIALYKKAYPIAGEASDSLARPVVHQYYDQIRDRDLFVSSFNCVNPAASMQQVYNALACTDVNSYLEYQKALESFHRRLVKFYHEPLFLNKTFTRRDFENKPAFTWHCVANRNNLKSGLITLLAWTALLFGIGYIRSRKTD